jgi:hypothetical protein
MEIRFHVITNHSLKLYCLDSTGRSSEEGGEGFLLSDLLVLGSLLSTNLFCHIVVPDLISLELYSLLFHISTSCS